MNKFHLKSLFLISFFIVFNANLSSCNDRFSFKSTHISHHNNILSDQLNGCYDICKIDKKGFDSLYYNYIEKDVNCEALMTNKAIDAPMIGNPPDVIPENMVTHFLYGGMVNYRNFAEKPLHEVYLSSTAQTSTWTREKIDDWKNQCSRGVLEGNYGSVSTNALFEVMKKSNIIGGSVAVLGSENPWVESCALAAGASRVTTIEYGKIISLHYQITTYTPDKIRENPLDFFESFDVIISFSSVEHSGLGRYGDALNPWGDRQAIARAWCMTKPGGYMVLAVPLGDDAIEYNAHRIYGKIQLPHLTANWHQVFKYEAPVQLSYDQRPFLYQKRHSTYFNSTQHKEVIIEKPKMDYIKTHTSCDNQIDGPLCFGHMHFIKPNNGIGDTTVLWKQPLWNFGNMLGTYWSARVFAYLSGKYFSAQWVNRPDIFKNLPSEKPKPLSCNYNLLHHYCKICDRSVLLAPIVEYPNECPHIYEPIQEIMSQETHNSVSSWLYSLDKKPFFMDLDRYAVIQLRCEILKHVAYGPNAFSIYDNLPYDIEDILIIHPLLPHTEGDPNGFCKPILNRLMEHIHTIRPESKIHEISQTRELDFAAFVKASVVIREVSSTFSLFSALASNGHVYSSRRKSYHLADVGYPNFGDKWHWTDTPMLIPEETKFHNNSPSQNQVIEWLLTH